MCVWHMCEKIPGWWGCSPSSFATICTDESSFLRSSATRTVTNYHIHFGKQKMSSQNEAGILNSDSRIVGFGNAPSSKSSRSGCIGKVTSLVLLLISAALAVALAVTLLRVGEGTASQSGPSPWLLACYPALRDITVNQTEVYYNAATFVSFPQYNIPSLLPYFTVLPTTVEQVQRALKCAKRYNLKVSIKGGGHNYAGFSQAPLGGFQISLQSMRNFSYVNFNGTPALRTQPGVAFGDTYGFLNEYHPDLLLAGGLCPSVGIVGFHLGGGMGPLSRLYGVGCDNLLQATMLTVNGSDLVVANETSNPDLFWALRGGGGPSFGVVVEMIIRLNPNPHQNFSYGEFCVGTDISNITANLQKYAAKLAIEDFPDWLTVHWRLVKRRPPKLSGLCYLIYSIRNASETEAAIARSIGENQVFQSQGPLKGDPEWAFIQEHPTYMEMVAANAVCTQKPMPAPCYLRSTTPSSICWFKLIPRCLTLMTVMPLATFRAWSSGVL